METKDQLQKILEWMKQISGTVATKQDLSTMATKQDLLAMASKEDLLTMATKDDLLELGRQVHSRMDGLDDRFDSLSEAVQYLLKAMRGLRADQRSDRVRFGKEIRKIRQEIHEWMH